jgi:hypothetical protein
MPCAHVPPNPDAVHPAYSDSHVSILRLNELRSPASLTYFFKQQRKTIIHEAVTGRIHLSAQFVAIASVKWQTLP